MVGADIDSLDLPTIARDLALSTENTADSRLDNLAKLQDAGYSAKQSDFIAKWVEINKDFHLDAAPEVALPKGYRSSAELTKVPSGTHVVNPTSEDEGEPVAVSEEESGDETVVSDPIDDFLAASPKGEVG